MSTIKDKNGMDLTAAEDSKKRWQEYTELCKKALNDPDIHDGVITAEFPKFAGLLSAALSQYHLLGFEIAQLELHHLH